MSDEVKLLPCDWCGKIPSIVCPDNSYGSALITCGDINECPVDVAAWADLSRGETLETAIAAWNTRAIEATRPPIGTDEVVERVDSVMLEMAAASDQDKLWEARLATIRKTYPIERIFSDEGGRWGLRDFIDYAAAVCGFAAMKDAASD